MSRKLPEGAKLKNNKLFVYGILKRGYELDLRQYGATFLGEAHINGATLFGIGAPYKNRKWSGVGLKLDPPNTEHLPMWGLGPHRVAHGELWEVPDPLWAWLDGIEQNGFCYTRKITDVSLNEYPVEAPYDGESYKTVKAWVYEYSYPGFTYKSPIKEGRF